MDRDLAELYMIIETKQVENNRRQLIKQSLTLICVDGL